MNPIDLLPINRPLEEENTLDELFFYNNVIKALIPDIIKMSSTGIPIDLNKVEEVQTITDNMLDDVTDKLNNNPIIKEYLQSKQRENEFNTLAKFDDKEFNEVFNPKNTKHRTWIVNSYLKEHGDEKDVMEKWTLKDLKKYAAIKGYKFLEEIANNKYSQSTESKCEEYINQLGTYKKELYKKNLKEKIKKQNNELTFNPGSAKQKIELFKFLGISSETKTKKGSEQWNRDQLEELLKKLKDD